MLDRILLALALFGLVAAGHYVQQKAVDNQAVVFEFENE